MKELKLKFELLSAKINILERNKLELEMKVGEKIIIKSIPEVEWNDNLRGDFPSQSQ